MIIDIQSNKYQPLSILMILASTGTENGFKPLTDLMYYEKDMVIRKLSALLLCILASSSN